ncbi:DUF5691 domain-containing protein [Rariglobus hedericola]|uniref:Uncharacterized protein n=1 Tax=Rariglobus hedericola TaxID=2597822 RepID=A0A556QR13_9BACT|nr:DUF5691 domain-containing protein [Rariglobus hedericola]TSJ79081.1 hypothetical protein FPL22_07240 [Rariglobus hedericola]
MNRDPFSILTLLGTERMTAPPSAPHPVLAEAWAGLDWTARETAALSAMALVASARGAGAVAVKDSAPEPDPAPEESLSACPAGASALLRRMLAGEHAVVLSEWLALAAARKCRVRFRDLPALLRVASRERSLREAVLPVLGERGVWLARRADEWRRVLETAKVEDTAWETGELSERIAWLRQTRASDPTRAAEALAKAWAGATGEERERFTTVLAEAPTSQDVALLEGEALRDRRREVRLSARASLLRLPESAFSQRARTLVASMVVIEGMLMMRRLALRLPETFDAAWKADGIEEKPPAGTGPRAFWARQWIASVPLSAWTSRLDVGVEKLFALNRDDEWREIILLGWIDAATAAPEKENAEAFALHLIGLADWPKAAPSPAEVLPRLLTVLDPEAGARVLAAVPATDAGEGLYFELLFCTRFHLPDAAAREALQRCLAAFQAKPYPRLQSNHARELARRLPLATAGEAVRRLAALSELSSPAEELLRAIEFRQQVHQAFTVSIPS